MVVGKHHLGRPWQPLVSMDELFNFHETLFLCPINGGNKWTSSQSCKD